MVQVLKPAIGHIWEDLHVHTQVLVRLSTDRSLMEEMQADLCLEYLEEFRGEPWVSDKQIDDAMKDIYDAIHCWREWRI